MSDKNWYMKRRENHMCLSCGEYAEGQFCEKCRERVLQDRRLEYKRYRDLGICVECKTRDAQKGRARCEMCAAKNAERSYRIKPSTGTLEKNRERYQRYIEHGLCPKCSGRHKLEDGYRSCRFCRNYAKENQKKNSNSISIQIRQEEGICRFCDEKALSGKRTCQKHYENLLKNIEVCRKSKIERR